MLPVVYPLPNQMAFKHLVKKIPEVNHQSSVAKSPSQFLDRRFTTDVDDIRRKIKLRQIWQPILRRMFMTSVAKSTSGGPGSPFCDGR